MLADAYLTFANAFSEGIRPESDLTMSDWAQAHRIVPHEGSSRPGRWDNSIAPFAVEPMNCLSVTHPCNHVVMMKSAQITGSEIIMNAVGYIIDVCPGPTMVAHPSLEAAKDWGQEKLEPNIDANPRLKNKFAESKSRDGKNTVRFKSFPGGYVVLGGANSSKSLRQKSIRFMMKDDFDDWPFDVGGQGDPSKMADARQISYHAVGNYKNFEVSTPTIEATSRITKAYKKSDQRTYQVLCPHCGKHQELNFFPVSKDPFKGGLKFNKTAPFNAYYVCEHNGCVIEHYEKQEMLQKGYWKVNNPEGRYPGFKIGAMYSPFTTWDKMAEEFVEAKDDPLKLKTFYNLWLGEPWKEKGDAPDYKRLMALRDDYTLGEIPAGGLIMTCGIDVQEQGFYYETIAWGIGKTNWSIDKGFIEGDTNRPEVWMQLDQLANRKYMNAYGREFGIDQIGIDANYRPHMVHAWVRKNPRAMATRGEAGHAKPVLGTPQKQQISYSGRKVKGGLLLWPIGTWAAKMEAYGYLRLEGIKEGKETNPLGYCHFSSGHDDNFFKQLTAESLITRTKNGRTVTEWAVSGHNHFLDCRVINLAISYRLELDRFTYEAWQRIAAERNTPLEVLQGDLFLMQREMSTVPVSGVKTEMEATELPNEE